MKKRSIITLEVDDQGRFFLPSDVSKRYGFTAGAMVRLEEDATGLHFSRSSSNLARLYVEPTNLCNFDCSICMRKVWDERLGRMDFVTFSSILQGVHSFQPVPTVFFGGFGEPLTHPDILEMITAAKSRGAEVEIITNGILLSEAVAQKMVEVGMDRVWVSMDGATPESYADVRLGNELPQIISNLARLQELRAQSEQDLPKLGIAFVAMRRNIADFPEVIKLGKRLGADQFSVSNVLPHTAELRDQVLYARSMYESGLQPSRWSPEVALPRMDLNTSTVEFLAEVMKNRNELQVTRQPLDMGVNTCPFMEKGSIAVRWDGAVNPLLTLLHTHESYLDENLRKSHAYAVGNIRDRSLADLWNDSDYVHLRERLQAFDFAPCTFCKSCEMAESNLEDCFGNTPPACGGCL